MSKTADEAYVLCKERYCGKAQVISGSYHDSSQGAASIVMNIEQAGRFFCFHFYEGGGTAFFVFEMMSQYESDVFWGIL